MFGPQPTLATMTHRCRYLAATADRLFAAGLRQRGAVPARCLPSLSPEHRGQMALVAKPDLVSDLGKG